MRFVEAVFGEFGAGLEDHFGIALADAALDRAGDEIAALRRHLLLVLLAHGAAQDIGLAEAIAGEIARDLLHLFLIGDDAVGRLQDRLEFRMQIIGALVAELARAIGRNVRHRPRPVERDQHDQVFEAVGPHVDQRPAHALTFHLEDADRLATGPAPRRSWCRRGGCASRSMLDAPRLTDQLHGAVSSTVSVVEAEEIELHETGRLDPFHVELSVTGIVRFGVTVEWHELIEGPLTDHDAGGMGRGVAVAGLRGAGRCRRRAS